MSFVYDPSAPGFADASHAVYRRMRDEFPVWADPAGRFHALSRYADVLAATRDWETFSSTGKLEAVYSKPTMNSFDPPRHTQLRALVSRAFTPRRVSDLEPEIAWGELFARIPDYALVEKPHRFISSTFYGWEALPIGF